MIMETRLAVKSFREFYEEIYGRYPGYPGEEIHRVQMRVFEATADYLDYLGEVVSCQKN